MTSRERVISSINHREPDKVPVDLGSSTSTGISALAYANLLKYLGKEDLPVRIYDVVQQLARPDEVILNHFGIDAVDIGQVFNTSVEEWYEIKLQDGQAGFFPQWFHPEDDGRNGWHGVTSDGEVIAKMPASSTFFDQTFFPWLDAYPEKMDRDALDQAMGKVMWSLFAKSPWDKASIPGFWEELRKRASELREESNRAIVVAIGGNLFEYGCFLRRMDQFLMDLYLDPGNVSRLIDVLMERHMATLEKTCFYLGDIADIVRFGDDLGTMNGPLMDPATYRDLFKPHHSRLCSYVRENSSMHTLLHSCGSIYQLLPDLIEAGFDILNPVQTACRDMDPKRLKKEFGRDITFWGGGIEPTKTLNYGTPDDVRREVLERLEIFSKGGGYVFNSVHNILMDVPPSNIVAMFEAVKEFNGD